MPPFPPAFRPAPLDRLALWAADTAARWLSRLPAIAAVAGFLLAFLAALHARPVTTAYRISTPQGGPPVRLALVTDLHSCRYGKNQSALLRRIERTAPDAVLLGGDIFDDRLPDANTLAFLDAAAARWPCFYVTGNHEFWSGRVGEMKDRVRARGIPVLDGAGVTLDVRGRKIDICGLDDPTYMEPREWHPPIRPSVDTNDPTCHIGPEWRRQLAAATAAARPDHAKILLTHRPERVSDYKNLGFDLVLAGHAHGGQVALPFGLLPGLYAPSQGWFPRYAGGLYDIAPGTRMIVSRGLARESLPLPRWFNRPELVAVTLE